MVLVIADPVMPMTNASSIIHSAAPSQRTAASILPGPTR
jgi:hypothetical protein